MKLTERGYRILAVVVLALACIGIVGFAAWPAHSDLHAVDLRQIRFEIADTDAARRQGLSDRSSLDADAGMLFVFPERGNYPFWMQRMHFPLDIIWVDGDRVVDVVTLDPPSSADAMPASHTPNAFADRVIELNAGSTKTMGLKLGYKVILP